MAVKDCLYHIALFRLEDVKGEKTILVYLKLNKQTLSTKSFMEHSSPGELTVLAELLNQYSRVGT